jgi:hypothetical protein
MGWGCSLAASASRENVPVGRTSQSGERPSRENVIAACGVPKDFRSRTR